jgi:hypothetical protein
MSVPGLAKSGVVLLTARVMLHAEASSNLHGVSDPLVAAVTHHDLPLLPLCFVSGAVPLCARRT